MIQSTLTRAAKESQLKSDCLTQILSSSPQRPEIEGAIADCKGEWAISQALARLLANAVITQTAQNILEFGAGSSSRIFARSLSALGGGQLTSLEQNPQWCRDTWDEVKQTQSINCQMIQVSPRLTWGITGLHYAFTQKRHLIQARGPFDLVLVDSPQYFFGREGAMPLIYRHLLPNALIFVDDAGRKQEQSVIYRWLKSFPGLKLLYFDPMFGGKGVAILQYETFKPPQLSSAALLTNARHLVYLFLQYPDFWDLRNQELRE